MIVDRPILRAKSSLKVVGTNHFLHPTKQDITRKARVVHA